MAVYSTHREKCVSDKVAWANCITHPLNQVPQKECSKLLLFGLIYNTDTHTHIHTLLAEKWKTVRENHGMQKPNKDFILGEDNPN